MRKCVFLCLLLLVLSPVDAQQFIGCRTESSSTRTPGGWVEMPMLRKTFTITANDLKHYDFQTLTFSVSVASLGYHELYINGTKVGDHVMQPAVSQLDKRALKVDYDITPYIHKGDNEIMLWLGQGWGRIYGTPAVAMAEVIRSVSDGECGLEVMLAHTDSTWEASPSGYSYTDNWQPMHFGGERYDARVKERWRPASVYNAKDITVSRQEFAGNRNVGALLPQSIDTLSDGTFLIDFGRVVTGWFQLQCLPIPEGDVITMEYLDHRDAKPPFTETDIYVSDGNGDDDIHFTNRFHMHSFRYVKVKGLAHYLTYGLDIPILMASAVQISAVDPYGGATFECSDPRLNAIHDMVKYTLSCLTFSGYMVDCPHIERMGYGGDGNSSTMTLQTFWDVRDLYANWLTSWGDAIDSTGDLPYVAPAFRTGGGPYWSGFIIKAPWRTYLNYGDRSLIYEHYDKMVRWLDFVERHCEDGILRPWTDTERRAWFLGDWAVPELWSATLWSQGVDKGGESVLHVSNCFLAECLSDMVQMACMTGHHNDAVRFAAWRERLVKDIHRHFYHLETHTYANGTVLDQCYALLTLADSRSLTEKNEKKEFRNDSDDSVRDIMDSVRDIMDSVRERLLEDIHGKYRDHIAVGLVGVPIFTEWCIRERQADLMATILRQEDYPGYLNMINQGATTTWESWDCGRPGKEDRSRVHNCYNGIGIWFYQALAGIQPDPEHPGYKHFFIDPQPVEGIDWLRATKPTQYGTIKVEVKNGMLKVDIPQGTTATVFPSTPRERTVTPGEWTFEMK